VPPFDCVATATDEATCIAKLVRREGEALNQLINRLDKAIQLAWTDNWFVDEVNDGPSDRL
jgi:ribosome assembly protein YihI (activator of Der GTPase)